MEFARWVKEKAQKARTKEGLKDMIVGNYGTDWTLCLWVFDVCYCPRLRISTVHCSNLSGPRLARCLAARSSTQLRR